MRAVGQGSCRAAAHGPCHLLGPDGAAHQHAPELQNLLEPFDRIVARAPAQLRRRHGKAPYTLNARLRRRVDDQQARARQRQIAVRRTGRHHHAARGVDKSGAAGHFQLHAPAQRVEHLGVVVRVRRVFAAVLAHRKKGHENRGMGHGRMVAVQATG